MSAVREAIEAVLQSSTAVTKPYDSAGFYEARIHEGLVDRLVTAVERVPVQVTIRELDMADSENIVTIKAGEDVRYVGRLVEAAVAEHEDLHLTVDGGYLKVAFGGYSFSAPIETEVYNP